MGLSNNCEKFYNIEDVALHHVQWVVYVLFHILSIENFTEELLPSRHLFLVCWKNTIPMCLLEEAIHVFARA